jgi:hypothetical protein
LPPQFRVFCAIVLFSATDKTKKLVHLDKREGIVPHATVEKKRAFATRYR